MEIHVYLQDWLLTKNVLIVNQFMEILFNMYVIHLIFYARKKTKKKPLNGEINL